MQEQAQQDQNVNLMANLGYQAAGALQIRLNTEPILREIHTYLSGEMLILGVSETGEPVEKKIPMGEPLANKVGIQRIMSYLQGIFNPQIVQGNFDLDRYEDYLFRHRRSLATDIVLNLKRYGINPDDVNGIMDRIFTMIEPFLSRTLANKERESYAQTIKSVESSTSQVRGNNKIMGLGLP